ncbi:MAG TPA: Asp-tRNA(Asn)/Glu-tRNA(Gln) amidotransferase subunit GatC [Candidatus Saccharimonadales bacterium]|nr:Asp-tRNA(Asn)/Glu-tRNA(Gln) amidotransferase subunit GatC [Candidatus Saccharimonadales bacterium]
MTTVSRDDVMRLAQLSGLQLADGEADALTTDISTILTYIHQLNELDTEGVIPTYQVTGLENVWRDDKVVEETVHREQLLALTSESLDHQVKVPKVL